MTKKKVVKSIPELAMALEVSNVIDLKDLALIESRSKLFPVSRATNGYDYAISASTHFNVEDENKTLLVKVQLKFRGKNKNAQDVVFLEAVYIAVYSLSADNVFSTEHYANFSNYCTVFHVWPYWREFVERSVAAFRMPPLTLPVLRFGARLPNEDISVSSEHLGQVEKKSFPKTKRHTKKSLKQQ